MALRDAGWEMPNRRDSPGGVAVLRHTVSRNAPMKYRNPSAAGWAVCTGCNTVSIGRQNGSIALTGPSQNFTQHQNVIIALTGPSQNVIISLTGPSQNVIISLTGPSQNFTQHQNVIISLTGPSQNFTQHQNVIISLTGPATESRRGCITSHAARLARWPRVNYAGRTEQCPVRWAELWEHLRQSLRIAARERKARLIAARRAHFAGPGGEVLDFPSSVCKSLRSAPRRETVQQRQPDRINNSRWQRLWRAVRLRRVGDGGAEGGRSAGAGVRGGSSARRDATHAARRDATHAAMSREEGTEEVRLETHTHTGGLDTHTRQVGERVVNGRPDRTHYRMKHALLRLRASVGKRQLKHPAAEKVQRLYDNGIGWKRKCLRRRFRCQRDLSPEYGPFGCRGHYKYPMGCVCVGGVITSTPWRDCARGGETGWRNLTEGSKGPVPGLGT
ncbi:hypothetical protein Bbelb_165350 [Branchiostoma belcheri]|nr:hypothetical protein Bbelb_165350 [Branchiostoma belcheri]